VEALLAKMAVWPVVITENVIRFCLFRRESKGFDCITYITLGLAKSVIWQVRCLIRFESKCFDSNDLVNMFKAQFGFRCKVDFARLPRALFKSTWCREGAICVIIKDKLKLRL